MNPDVHTISVSFDTDHMNGDRMEEFLRNSSLLGAATFYCTQRFDCLAGSVHELAPHPYLGKNGDWLKELQTKRAEFPEARGWRSHSCVFSHILAEWLAFNGYLYASTVDLFGQRGLRPSLNMWGVWQMPIYYMDNLDISQSRFWPSSNKPVLSADIIESALDQPGTYVFDFHPIHLLLNTPDPDTYSTLRGRFLAGEDCRLLRHQGRGAHTFFCDLMEAMDRRNMKSVSVLDALLAVEPDAHAMAIEPSDYAFEDWRINDIKA